jgi:hypothetical protein
MLDLAHAPARQSPADTPAGRYTLAGFSAGAAAVHLAVIAEHLTEYWPFAVFFAAVAAFQAAWALAVLTRPQPGLYRLGAVASGGLISLWALSRTSGLPLGPEHWHPEAVSMPDAIAVAFEIGLILTVWIRRRSRQHEPRTRPRRPPEHPPCRLLGGPPIPASAMTQRMLTATKGGGYVQGMRLREDQHPTHAD